MKKGFTMIELIFVIVILGILASVAIPRLAATKTDAETSAVIGNARTLISDASAYYVAKGQFGTATFAEVSNVKVKTPTAGLTTGSSLQVSGKDCVDIKFTEAKLATDGSLEAPAFATITQNASADNICKQAMSAPAIKALVEGKFKDAKGVEQTGLAIGSGNSIYGSSTTGTPGNSGTN